MCAQHGKPGNAFSREGSRYLELDFLRIDKVKLPNWVDMARFPTVVDVLEVLERAF